MKRYSRTLVMVAGLLSVAVIGCSKEPASEPAAPVSDAAGTTTNNAANTTTGGTVADPNAANTNIGAEAGAAVNAGERKTSDGWLTFKVASALYADTRYEGEKLDVDTQGGVVTLKGIAFSQAGKDAATQIAQGIEGVGRVDNQLSVVPENRQKVVDDKDDVIKKSANDLLDKDPAFKDFDIDADVVAGKVTLKGEVPDPRVAYQIVSAVRAIPGVKMVDGSEIKLKSQD